MSIMDKYLEPLQYIRQSAKHFIRKGYGYGYMVKKAMTDSKLQSHLEKPSSTQKGI